MNPQGPRFVSYLRVSTQEQGRSGLGLEAQRAAIESHCAAQAGHIIREFVETESGKRADRPKLIAAQQWARQTGATLVVAKLDRLGRNVKQLATLMEDGLPFVAVDNPHAGSFILHVLAAVAEEERRLISERTKAALAAAKARGVKLGNPNGAAALRGAPKTQVAALQAVRARASARADSLGPIVAEIQAEGFTSLPAIAAQLNARSIQTARGGKWHASSVSNLLARLSLA